MPDAQVHLQLWSTPRHKVAHGAREVDAVGLDVQLHVGLQVLVTSQHAHTPHRKEKKNTTGPDKCAASKCAHGWKVQTTPDQKD